MENTLEHLSLEYWIKYLDDLTQFKDNGKKDCFRLMQNTGIVFNGIKMLSFIDEEKMLSEIDRVKAIISVLSYRFEIYAD